jgi:hypothetical protein
MKTSKILLLLLIFISNLFFAFTNIYSQWTEVTVSPLPPKLNCSDCYTYFWQFEGCIGGDSGTILYSSNNGSNWLYRNNTVVGTNNINVVSFLKGNESQSCKGIFCAANSSTSTFIYRSTNKGLNWAQVYSQSNGRIRSIDSNTCYALGDPVGGRWTILKSTNAGITFDTTGLYLPQTGSEVSNYNTFYISRFPELYMFGTNNGKIYRSTNCTNWSPITIPFQNIYFISLGHYSNGSMQGYQTGYAAGNGAVYTTNYGQNWTTSVLPGTGDIHAMFYDLGGISYACYAKGNQIYATTNSSQAFTLEYTSPNGGNYTNMSLAVHVFEGGERCGWAVKDNGTISRYFHNIAGINKINSEVPSEYSLFQNYPNPFNPSTKIKFDIPADGKRQTADVKIIIYDITGKEISVLVNQQLLPGTYEVEWDASNYSSGIYFYKLEAADFNETKRMVLVK